MQLQMNLERPFSMPKQVLFAFLLIVASILTQQENGICGRGIAQAAENKNSSESGAPETATTYFTPGHQIDADTYRTICNEPKNKDHADLCQQWRVAEAAETQVWLTGISLLLIIGTTVFTGIAAAAARSAAKEASVTARAARAANQLSRDFFAAEQRPWIQIAVERGDDLRVDASGVYFRPKVRIISSGRVPAENVRQHWELWPDVEAARTELNRITAEQLTAEDDSGELLFPGQDAESAPKLKILKSQIGDRSEIAPALIGCVTYQTNITAARFQTVYFARVERIIRGNSLRTFSVNSPGKFDKNSIRIAKPIIRDGAPGKVRPADDEEED
jgi:hypothetical protein